MHPISAQDFINILTQQPHLNPIQNYEITDAVIIDVPINDLNIKNCLFSDDLTINSIVPSGIVMEDVTIKSDVTIKRVYQRPDQSEALTFTKVIIHKSLQFPEGNEFQGDVRFDDVILENKFSSNGYGG